MSRATQVVVICEDAEHRHFVRGYLSQLRFPMPRVHFEVAPSGKGDAKEWVRKRLIEEVGLIAARAKYLSVYCVVVVDCDQLSPVERRDWLLKEVDAQQLGDKLVCVTPSTNIEDWLARLDGSLFAPRGRKKAELGRHAHRLGSALSRDCRDSRPTPEFVQDYCTQVRSLRSALQ